MSDVIHVASRMVQILRKLKDPKSHVQDEAKLLTLSCQSCPSCWEAHEGWESSCLPSHHPPLLSHEMPPTLGQHKTSAKRASMLTSAHYIRNSQYLFLQVDHSKDMQALERNCQAQYVIYKGEDAR